MKYIKEKRHAEYIRHVEKIRERARAYYWKHREERIAYARLPEVNNKRNMRRRELYALSLTHPIRKRYPQKYIKDGSTKIEVFNHYGGRCSCCGESDFHFLSIDHIANDGHLDKPEGRKTRRSGIVLYRYLKKMEYPNHVQLLCFNCNFAKNLNRGVCPHKK